MRPDSLKIAFVGDTSLTGIFYDKITANDEIFSPEIRQLLKSIDYTVCNLEGACTKTPFINSQTVNIASPSNTIGYLVKRGINIFNLANNHIFDCGDIGFKNTVKEIKANKVNYFGAGINALEAARELTIEKSGVRISLIGIIDEDGQVASKMNAGSLSFNKFKSIKKLINRAKQKSDWVILNYHGGEEFNLYPAPFKRKILKKFASINGLDIIIAHHSHTFQGIEKNKNCLIFYSLGNFIFDFFSHDIYEHTKEGALVQFNFKKDSYSYDITPTFIDKKRGLILPGSDTFNSHIKTISDFSNYKEKWRKDAWRSIFEQKEITIQQDRLKGKNTYQLLRSYKFYLRIIKILCNQKQRQVYWAAVCFLIQKKWKSINDQFKSKF